MILLDTTPLVALCEPRDTLHHRALGDLDRLSRKPLVVSSLVVTECCHMLAHPIQRERLAGLLGALSVRPLELGDESVVWPRVFAWLAKYAEHEPDWVDGHLVVAAGMLTDAKVWTYDGEFRTTWRREDGTRVPLAVR